MKVLVVGGGGREHALAWKLAQSSSKPEILCAPGNAGTAEIARNVAVAATDKDGLLKLAKDEKPALTVVGPEQPLCDGIGDMFRAEGLRVFGPTKSAARLEGSKAFAKQIMASAKIPTAAHRTFTNFAEAERHLTEDVALPIVVKASGLAAGKGVVVATTREEAVAAARRYLVEREFGDASATVVIEENLVGEEVSVLALSDGKTLAVLPAAQDHKRVFDGDEGPNTGGMGAYSPTPFFDERAQRRVEEEILVPLVHEMRVQGAPFQGCLFAGLMMTRNGPKTLEFNVRFGDPETQAVLPRLKGDLLEILTAVAHGDLDAMPPAAFEIDPRPCVAVVLAAGGYPGSFRRGDVIEGVEDAAKLDDVRVFHAGTARRDGKLIVAGGRVLAISASGATRAEAAKRAYEAAALVRFPDVHYRKDVGARAVGAR